MKFYKDATGKWHLGPHTIPAGVSISTDNEDGTITIRCCLHPAIEIPHMLKTDFTDAVGTPYTEAAFDVATCSFFIKASGDGGIIESKYIFTGATESACRTSRDAYFTEFPTEKIDGRKIILNPTGLSAVLEIWYQVSASWLASQYVIKGPKGDMGPVGLTGDTGVMFVYKGTYDNSHLYAERDIVFYQGASYTCKQPSTGNIPTNQTYWGIIAEKGDTGISGLTWKGGYNATTAYVVNDVIGYDNAGTNTVYVCISAATGTLPTDVSKWNELPIKGARGDGGPKGDKGDKGDPGAQGPSGNGDVGDIKIIAGATAPAGWLLCDGSLVSRATYSGLFGNIGIMYGAGNGTTTFALPNMQGRVPIGKDTTTDFNTLGKTGGEKAHILVVAEMPNHAHTYSDTYGIQNLEGTFNNANACDEIERNETTSYVGGNQPHNNLQPYVVVNYCIKY